MKLTNNRFYFDYNATSPLNILVREYLTSGEVDFFNPSSIHQSGQLSKKFVLDSRRFLYDKFGLEETIHDLIFHSGATEGINTLLLGYFKSCFINKKKATLFYFKTDHPSILEQISFIEKLGFECVLLPVDSNGDFELKEIIDLINSKDGERLLNYTYVNNLTGVVWSLEKASKLKEATGAFIHVDAVQSVGKIKNFMSLEKSIDCYTYSGHKFGSLKGVGFSFVHKEFNFEPLFYGGGQEGGFRSGTQNVLGIHSLTLALSSLIDDFSFNETLEAKNYIENSLMEDFGPNIEIIGLKASSRNNNTICCIFKGVDASFLLTALDIQGIEVSSGPACSSSIKKPSSGLQALGYSDKDSSSSLRFSFSPLMKLDEAKLYYQMINKVIKHFF